MMVKVHQPSDSEHILLHCIPLDGTHSEVIEVLLSSRSLLPLQLHFWIPCHSWLHSWAMHVFWSNHPFIHGVNSTLSLNSYFFRFLSQHWICLVIFILFIILLVASAMIVAKLFHIHFVCQMWLSIQLNDLMKLILSYRLGLLL
jgi:hypothetical protein